MSGFIIAFAPDTAATTTVLAAVRVASVRWQARRGGKRAPKVDSVPEKGQRPRPVCCDVRRTPNGSITTPRVGSMHGTHTPRCSLSRARDPSLFFVIRPPSRGVKPPIDHGVKLLRAATGLSACQLPIPPRLRRHQLWCGAHITHSCAHLIASPCPPLMLGPGDD